MMSVILDADTNDAGDATSSNTATLEVGSETKDPSNMTLRFVLSLVRLRLAVLFDA